MAVILCSQCNKEVTIDAGITEANVRCPVCGAWFSPPDPSATPNGVLTGGEEQSRYEEMRHEMTRSGTAVDSECGGRSGDDQLFEALMYGATVEAAARVSGMSRRTAFRRLEDPGFRQRLARARATVRDNVVQRLVDASGDAIERLWHLTVNEDEFIQMRACGMLLDSMAKVQRVMLQYGDVVEESCRLEQHEYGQSHLQVLTQERTKTTRVG